MMNFCKVTRGRGMLLRSFLLRHMPQAAAFNQAVQILRKIRGVISGAFQLSSAFASPHFSLVRVQTSRLTATESGSGEFIAAEPERDLAFGRLRRVGAVHEVVRHRHRERFDAGRAAPPFGTSKSSTWPS